MNILTIGSPQYIPSDGLMSCLNCANPRDGVAWINLFSSCGYQLGLTSSTYDVKMTNWSGSRCPMPSFFTDHCWDNPGYLENIDEWCKKILETNE